MNEKPLGKITAILADLGLEVTYAYDDLVFIQHSAFLIQFTEKPEALNLFVNQECNPEESDNIVLSIISEMNKGGFDVEQSGKYSLAQNEDDTIKLEFL